MSAKKKKKSKIKTAWQGHGTKIEIHPDGKVVVYAKGNVKLKQASNDTAIQAAKDALEIGARMADGSVYAGLTPDGKQQIFAMPVDLALTKTFNEAVKDVNWLNKQKTLGHDDWQIPNLGTLRVLQKNQNEGSLKGTFTKAAGFRSTLPDWYWSSTEVRFDPGCVRIVRFTGGESWDRKDDVRLSCRPVRLVPGV